MEGRRFLVIIADKEEQANVKEKCEERGCSVICVNSPNEARKYISFLTNYHIVIIDVDPPNNEAVSICEGIKQISSETFIIALRSVEYQNKVADVHCNAMLLKPLYCCSLDMVLDNRKM